MAQINKPSEYFNTTLWTGDGNSTQNITGTGFNADWIWLKGRSGAGDHQLYDKVRGVQKMIISNGTNAESTNSIGLQTFGSDGFTMGSDMTGNGSTFASWNWLANGSGVSNTDGSITSTVSANTTSGFSIVTYTSGGGSGTVGHSLGSVPKVMFYKPLSTSGGWDVYHHSLGISNRVNLHNTSASSSGYFQTLPTSLVFTEPNLYSGQDVIMYCFAEKKGFSKFGSYTGNGNADGTFIYTGFKPALFLLKESNGTNSWQIFDNKRPGYNLTDKYLKPNENAAEVSGNNQIDMLSNGIKLRSSNTGNNGSGQSFIYMAFAENPLVGTNNIPATAR